MWTEGRVCKPDWKSTHRLSNGQIIPDTDNWGDNQDMVTLFGISFHTGTSFRKFNDSHLIISTTPPFWTQLHQSENPRILQLLHNALKNPLDSNSWLQVYLEPSNNQACNHFENSHFVCWCGSHQYCTELHATTSQISCLPVKAQWSLSMLDVSSPGGSVCASCYSTTCKTLRWSPMLR